MPFPQIRVKPLMALVVVSFIAGCSVNGTSNLSDDIASVAKKRYEDCQSSKAYADIRFHCRVAARLLEGEKLGTEARKKWVDLLENKGPNYQLLAAIHDRDPGEAKRAIQNGASVNHIFELSEVTRHKNGKASVLEIAFDRPDIETIEILLTHGADVSVFPSDKGNMFVLRKIGFGTAQRTYTHYADIGLLMIDHGYRLSPEAVLSMIKSVYRSHHSTKQDYEFAKRMLEVTDSQTRQEAINKIAEIDLKKEKLKGAMAASVHQEAVNPILSGRTHAKITAIGREVCRKHEGNFFRGTVIERRSGSSMLDIRVQISEIKIGLNRVLSDVKIWQDASAWDECPARFIVVD